MKKTKKALASLAIAGMLSMIPFNALAENAVPTRIGGYDATQTAVQIADQTGWTGIAVLASSTSYGMVDALTAGPLASFLKAPILLQEAGNVLNADTKAELTKLKVKTVYVTSGTAVISQTVLNQLTDMEIQVVPLGGVDRFETSVNIAKKMVALGANVTKVAVAFGWLNQDALTIGSIAAAQTEPILLTEKDMIPASVKAFLTANAGVKTTHVIGGTAVVSDAVKAQLPSATRLYGNTAYDTNVAVLKAFDSVLKYDHVFIANGETAIDALAGVPLAAKYNAGIVLTNGAANEGTEYVKSKMTSASIVTALGGTAVVSDVVRLGAVSTAPPVYTGGGGGGVIVTSASVNNVTDLTAALANSSITKITFAADITKDLTFDRIVTVDFGSYVLTGNVSFTGPELDGVSSLTGTAAKSIIGDLTVNTPKASFINKVGVSGNVNIVNVKIGTWTESVDGNKLIITDADGAKIIIDGSPDSITVSQNAAGPLTITVNAGKEVQNIICNARANIINNGTIGTLTANAPINLVANLAPGTITVGNGGSIATSGTDSAKANANVALKLTGSTISGSTLPDNTLTFSFANLRKDSGITVSKDSKLSLSIGASGPIGDFDLKAGTNSLLTSPLPNNANLNLSQTNMTAIFSAIKTLDSANKQAILNTVDFAKVLELVQQAGQVTQDAVFQQIGFEDFYTAISNADSATKMRILDNMSAVIDVSLTESTSNEATAFKSSVVTAMFPLLSSVTPELDGTQITALLDFYKANTGLKTLLSTLTVAQKESILGQINYTALFEAVMADLSPATRASMFKVVNFTDLFTASKSADAAEKAKITENLVNVMNTIEASDISRVEMLNALVFGANKRDALFQILKSLDGSSNAYVTVTATLTDGTNTKTYTFKINEN